MASEAMEFNIQISQYPDGFVGECLEIPAIIVQGKSEDAIMEQTKIALKGYLATFPQEISLLKSKQVKRVEVSV